jgi:CO/xanthine dehydrogenase Mo-binding subunit/aerobic-type carbon monoxide dehydrogenase small subunit (CoxS/CutS family)
MPTEPSRKRTISFTLNSRPLSLRLDPSRPLLSVLREDLGLTGTKQSCDMEGECGACTVIVDGVAQRSCLILAGELEGRAVETIEGIGSEERPHPLQTAFLRAGAVQCGYCTPGMILSAKALLDRVPSPSDAEITAALAGNLCRCTGYASILRAVRMAAEMLGDATSDLAGPPETDRNDARHDGWQRVSGATRFVEDIALPGLLHVAVVRSPHFHARVLDIDITLACSTPDVIRALTAADIPGENGLGGYSVGEPLLVPAGGEVRMRGDPLALVIASDAVSAREGAARVRADYEVLPHALEPPRDIPGSGAPAGDGILAESSFQTGDADAALRAADVRVSAAYEIASQAHMGLEREAALAYVDEGGILTVVGGTHEPHWARGYLARILGLPLVGVRVIAPPVGGSFGARQDVTPLALAALCAYHVRRPVRLAYSRREVMEAAPKRHAYRAAIEVSARRGEAGGPPRLSGLATDMVANTGAHDSGGRYIAEYAVTASGGAYRWDAIRSRARVLYTNAAKAGQFRGFGTPQPVLALECALDELCERLDADPLEFRLNNIIAPGEPLFLGCPPGETLGYRECLEAVRPDYKEMMERARAFNADPRNAGLRRGVGIAGMMYRFGKFGAPRSRAEVELGLDGRITLYTSAADYGQGIETAFLRLASQTLGVERAALDLVNADTLRTPDGDVAGASRAAYWVGSSLVDACRRLKQAMLDAAAEMLDAPPTTLEFREVGSAVEVRGDPARSLSFAEIAGEMANLGQPLRLMGQLDLSAQFRDHADSGYLPLFLTGAHVAEVEVDMASGQARCLRVSAAHDVGRVINPRDAIGQIEGGVMMGVGSALMEEYVSGQTLGLSTYHIPTATSAPEIRTHLIEVAGRYAAFGIKGLGEATFLPTPPAILNAISRAIGVRIRRTPATGEYILAAILG